MKSILPIIFIYMSVQTNAQNPLKYLDINQVKAGIYNRGDMHWNSNSGNASYEVPIGSGSHSDFATAFWIGGYDVGNQLHLAAQTYRQSGVDFWPGPLDTTNGAINSSTSNQYDKIWKLNQSDIDAFKTNFSNGNVQNGSYTPVADLLSWPAIGAGFKTRNMAPFMDVNGNHIYDPMTGGDYPIIKGDQSLYFIFNDNLAHGTGGLPLKVEIHATAYAYGNSALASQYPFLSKATFYNYKIINRSSLDYHDVMATLWTDVDLGYYGDDYIGCNVSGNYGYAYNGDNNDETVAGTAGYGAFCPAAGYQVLKGPFMPTDGIDNNNNGIIDEYCEQQLLSHFNYFNNSFPGVPLASTDPATAAEYFKYMTGYWKDGNPFTCGGNGYGGIVQTPFMYPGTTYTNGVCGSGNWVDATNPGDRRYMIGVGPFNFPSHSVQEIEYVHCTSFDYSAANNPVAKLKMDMQFLRNFSDIFDPVNCTAISVNELDEPANFNLFPNPVTSELVISFNQQKQQFTQVSIVDVLGKEIIFKTAQDFNQLTLNVSELQRGIYFAKVTVNGKCVTRKFVKE
ncbi:MAG: T9SS type A sorting domain-containing protein [Bacteroidota bacterium]